MHDILVVGVPLLAILGGVFFNNQSMARVEMRLDGRLDRLENNIKDVRSEIKDVRADLTNLRSDMHREFEQFYRTLGQHDARLDNLERER